MGYIYNHRGRSCYSVKSFICSLRSCAFCKTGGLADVAGSLPKELKQKGVDVRVVIPNTVV